MRLAVCVPTSGRVPATFAFALAQTCSFFAKWESCEKITLLMQESSVVHSNREDLVVRALAWNATHILWADDDMVWPPEAVLQLLTRNRPIVAINYPKRSFPIEFVAVGLDGKRIVTNRESTGVESVQYTGFGLCLEQIEVFKALDRPWFLPGYSPDMAQYTTEDAPHFVLAREAGYDPVIDHDASKMQIGHIGTHIYAHNQSAQMVEPLHA